MKDHPVAIITGAGRGIGKSIAMALAQDGYRTMLIARSAEQLDGVAREIIRQVNPAPELEPSVFSADVGSFEASYRTAQSIVRRCGRVDVLVNNAGMWVPGMLDVSAQQFGQLMAVNVTAALAFVQAVAPVMKDRHSGHIFNVASRAGKVGFPEEGAYSASKFALVGLSESLYKELARSGVKVTSLCPSWVDTNMAQEAGSPLGHKDMIQPEDLAKTIRWLLSLSPAACVKEVILECAKDID
jgi:NAD(P)-dependent dehydrogenase (short-subunit alcohol dehydrogenase family)